MNSTSRSLRYFAAIAAALTLASCSTLDSEDAAQANLAAQHRFNVYFDVAKTDLTPEAQQVIDRAVAEANRNTNAKILVVAPETDTKARRTNTVQALVAAGISAERIDARWIGPQGSPPVGVRDPRSRVVQISFEPDISAGSEPSKILVSKRVGD